jgi:hypothetical protein
MTGRVETKDVRARYGQRTDVEQLRYHTAWTQWQAALLGRNWTRADFWRTELNKLREAVC